MKKPLLSIVAALLLALSAQCLAEESLSDYEAAKKKIVISQSENNPIKQAALPLFSDVNLLTGEYVNKSSDFVVAGAEKISVTRFYNHLSAHDNRYGGWRYNPESFVVANFEWGGQPQFVSFGEHSGQINLFDKRKDNLFSLNAEQLQNYCNYQIDEKSGQAHLFNTTVKYSKLGDSKNGARFIWQGVITDGTGAIRSFTSPMHSWHSAVKIASRSKLSYSPNVWIPYMLFVTEERKPNGTYLIYGYDNTAYTLYPHFGLLKSITAYNNTKTKVLGSVTFNYYSGSGRNNGYIEVIGSDGRKARFTHTSTDPVFLGNVKAPGQPFTSFSYANDCLAQIEKPEGGLLKIEYDTKGEKIISQSASVGDKEALCPIAQFVYLENATKVTDGNGKATIYTFDTKRRLSTIEKYDGEKIYSIERNVWDDKTGDLLMISLEDSHGQIFKQREFVYDNYHNIIKENYGDPQERYTIFRTFSEDGYNLKLSETDEMGIITRFSYVPKTNLIAKELVLNQDVICKRTYYSYDDCVVCIKKIVDDGHDENPDNLQGITYRKITYAHPKKTIPCLGLPEIVEEKTVNEEGQEILLSRIVYTYHPSGQILQEAHYDSQGKFLYSIQNRYDEEERLIEQLDALGNRTRREYDANNNLIALSGPRADMRTTWAYDRMSRPIREEVWVDNAPTLITAKTYDKMGNLTSITDPYGLTTLYIYDAFNRLIQTVFPNGSIETKEYDILGNVIKEKDANGYETVRTYNFRGQVTSVYYPDGSEESFAYLPNSSLYSHIERNGAASFYTYDSFNNPIKTVVCSSRVGKVLKTYLATFSPFCKLSFTDPEGVTTYYKYDFAGRKIAEQTEKRTINYQYDTLGRLIKTIKGGSVYVQEYDLLDRITEKRTEDLSEKIYYKEQYSYDAAGNRIQLSTCNGTTEMQYNSLGQITLIKEPGDCITRISYKYRDVLTKVTLDPEEKQTVELFDSKGHLLRRYMRNKEQEILLSEEKSYDPCGNLLIHLQNIYQGKEQKGAFKTSFTYGPMNRVETKIENEDRITHYAYDKNGRVKALTKPDGTVIHYHYDNLGKLSRMYSSAKDVEYTYTYDRNDRFLSLHDRNQSATTSRTYDSYGNLTEEILASNFTLISSYDDFGKRTSFQLPDDSKIEYTYRVDQLYEVKRKKRIYTYEERDLLGNPTRIILPEAVGTISIVRNGRGLWDKYQAKPLKIESASYNLVGKLLSYTVTDPLGELKINHGYDSLGYLISDGEHTYLYNSLGFRTAKDSHEYTLDKFCQVTAVGKRCYAYDANGNLISDGEKSYTYDSLDRLTTVSIGKTVVKFYYDPFHRRIKEEVFQNKVLTDHHFFIWDDQEEIGCALETKRIADLRILGDRIDTPCPLAVAHEFNGTTLIPFYDYRGSVLTVVNLGTGEPVETYRYSGYGEELIAGGATPWRFLNQRLDSETNLIYGNKVYYDPVLGRYLTGSKSWKS